MLRLSGNLIPSFFQLGMRFKCDYCLRDNDCCNHCFFWFLLSDGGLASKGNKWPLTLALVFYVLDALVSILVFDLITLGFHVYAIYGIAQGHKKLPVSIKQPSVEPKVETKKDVIDVEAERKVKSE